MSKITHDNVGTSTRSRNLVGDAFRLGGIATMDDNDRFLKGKHLGDG